MSPKHLENSSAKSFEWFNSEFLNYNAKLFGLNIEHFGENEWSLHFSIFTERFYFFLQSLLMSYAEYFVHDIIWREEE